MTKIIALIGVVAAMLTTGFSLNAQTTNSTPVVTNSVPWYGDIIGFEQRGSTNKQLTLAMFPSYSPNLVVGGKKEPWGFGLALLYPVATDYTFIGGRLDYLASDFWAPSANITVKADVQLFGVEFTPFALGGAIYPLGGLGNENHEVSALVGGGAYVTFWKGSLFKNNASLQGFFKYERWFNLDADVYSPGVAFTMGF